MAMPIVAEEVSPSRRGLNGGWPASGGAGMGRLPRSQQDRRFRHLIWCSRGLIRPDAQRNEAGLSCTELPDEVAPLLTTLLEGAQLSRDEWDALDGLAEKVGGNEECRVTAVGPLGSCRLVLQADKEHPDGPKSLEGYRVTTNLG